LVYGAPNRSCRARTLPVARGHAFDAEDRLRGQVIEQLMCFGAVDIPAVLERFGASGDLFAEEFEELSEYARQGVVSLEHGIVRVLEDARSLVRVVAAVFDAYYKRRLAQYSIAV
jgi:oxygen-independent coproporphyrinogen-3 oxidase